MCSVFLLPFTLILAAYAFYKWTTCNNNYFQKRHIKFKEPTFLIGNSAPLFSNKFSASEYAQVLYNAFPDEP